MYITCPNCKTPFNVDGVMIDAVGRPVRCFNCQKIWHQYPVAAQPPPPQYAAPPPPTPPPPPEPEPVPAPPPEREPAPAPEPEPEPAPEEEHPSDGELDQMLGPEEEIESVDVLATSDDDITDIDAEALESIPDPEPLGDIHSTEDDDEEYDDDFDPDDIPDPDPIPNLLSETLVEGGAPKKSLIKRLIMPLIIFIVIAAIGAGLVVMRETVVRQLPIANDFFYDLIGLHVDIPGVGLKFNTSDPSRETRDGKDSIVVRGTITNISDSDKPVPVILINAFDGNGQLVQSEKMSPAKSLLKPGEKFNYSAVIHDIVPTARRVDVTFGELESAAPKDANPMADKPKEK